MNANAKKWVRALKSGKYKQGKHYLRENDSFCCLGVACELAVKAGVIDAPEIAEDKKTYRYGNSRFDLTRAVINWLGLSSSTGKYENDGGLYESLSDLNDWGKRFTTIARIIESEPKGLFKESK